jgi:serine/threonine protein kinase
MTQAYLPPQQIDGEESSLAKIGHTGSATLPPATRTDDAKLPPSDSVPLGPTITDHAGAIEPGEGETREVVKGGFAFEVEGEIARGGMGAVMRAVDQDIRREVAVKFLLNHADERLKARFIEEAQITGQLEHPNIVPIHQLCVHEDGRCFFSMKMVKGRSLAEILKHQGEPGASATGDFTLGRLLDIFTNICNALAYAHSCGVIHRDLKPANVMVGDFGEVYVMDWGLAKALNESEASATVAKKTGAHASGPSAKIATNRAIDSNLTQDGSILGTPAYMPPEQARGDLAAIDQRSDIYSLGAILYEIMTLSPPVGRSGDAIAILMRVTEGAIKPPEKQAPERARQGWMPPELSAVAMKALALDPAERYQSVEALHRDIQLYMEGRSVSAKQDSAWEMFKKLVKRNKGVSIATSAGLLMLALVAGFFLKINYNARIEAESQRTRAEQALGAFEQEQKDKQERTRQAIPALVVAARQVANASSFPDAHKQVDLALLYDPANAEAHLLKGQLLLGQKEWTKARPELEQYLAKQPHDADARRLLALCSPGKVSDAATQFAVAEVLARQNVPGPAIPLLQEVSVEIKKREPLLPVYQKQIDVNWKGLGGQMRLRADAQFELDLNNVLGNRPVNNLDPLKGMQLNVLRLDFNPVSDLTPLQGMPLTDLNLLRCSQVRDLAPLKGMPLTFLNLQGCHQLKDLTSLKGLPLNSLILSECPQADLTPLQGLPLTSLELAFCNQVRDLTLLKGMPLTYLDLRGCDQVRDLTPLKGMPLTHLNLEVCGQIKDLTPLKGMPLAKLNLQECGLVSDLTPLAGMPLTSLNLSGCAKVKDLTPLRGMNLTEIYLNPPDKGMDVLRQMKSLFRINQLPPAEFWKKYDGGEFK